MAKLLINDWTFGTKVTQTLHVTILPCTLMRCSKSMRTKSLLSCFFLVNYVQIKRGNFHATLTTIAIKAIRCYWKVVKRTIGEIDTGVKTEIIAWLYWISMRFLTESVFVTLQLSRFQDLPFTIWHGLTALNLKTDNSWKIYNSRVTVSISFNFIEILMRNSVDLS